MIIELKSISKNFIQGGTEIIVLNDISVIFEQNKSYAITGVSGTGKSTLMHILAGIEKPSFGHVLYNNIDINSFSKREKDKFLNQKIGLVLQDPHLIKELSVLENVMLKGIIKKTDIEENKKRAYEVLEAVGLLNKMNAAPASLSGGEQQRVALARAIFNKPDFLLADEPTGHLDEKTGHAITQLMIECQQRWNMGLIVSTHDSYVANSMEHKFQLTDNKIIKI